MRLVVFSHKPCWRSSASSTGYATDGGFPFQMQVISELFDAMTLVVPVLGKSSSQGEIPITGNNLSIAPITFPWGSGVWRKLAFPFWMLFNSFTILREIMRSDAVHTPIPGDVGTAGMLLSSFFRKPLFVRHCGNWFVQTTLAEHFWKWFMERFAGGRNVMLATGGADQQPSKSNPNIHWIFATSLTAEELSHYSSLRTFPNNPHLIIVCRQEVLKGTAIVIQACALLLDANPALLLDVVGAGTDLADFQNQAISLGLKKQVRFHGQVNHQEVVRLLRSANLFCYPTAASEGFPKVVLEALATGLPVITTPVSVLPQLLTRGGGVLINERTPEAVARAVQYCLSNRVRYTTMSRMAIETAKEYSLESWRDQIGAHLEAVWGPLSAHD